MEKRYYYKNKNGGLMNLKSPKNHPDLIEITEQEFNELSKPKEPTAKQKGVAYLQHIIHVNTKEINKLKDELLDVFLLGKKDENAETKRQKCIELQSNIKEIETELDKLNNAT